MRRCSRVRGGGGRGTHRTVGNYDYDGALLFNQSLRRLWNNTTTRWRRAFGKEFKYFAVTEAQKRGTMRKHVLVRFARGSILAQELLAVAGE